jgi:hypothetical protein
LGLLPADWFGSRIANERFGRIGNRSFAIERADHAA